MVLGLVEFLLGGKKKNKVPKTAQATTPLSNVGGGMQSNNVQVQQTGPANIPDGQNNPTQNVGNNSLQFEDTSNQQQNMQSQQSRPAQQSFDSSSSQKKSISDIIGKIHNEIKSSNERIAALVGDVKSIENTVNTIGHRIDELEESKKVTEEKLAEMDDNMTKFLSLYELINNQYNPFVDKDFAFMAPKAEVKETIKVSSDGSSIGESNVETKPDFSELKMPKTIKIDTDDLDSSLLELDTLNIEEAAGNAVPLTVLKNNTNSLVIILSWLEYLIKRVGIEETRNTLRYYTEVLRWITPEVYFDLDKYLRGMKDKDGLTGSEKLTVRDHIVSLYFISKLNEKALDEKLTKAVLQIIKQ